MKDNARVKIFRFDPMVDKEPRYETYEVPSEAWCGVKIIDTLRYIYEHFAPGLSFREPCRQQLCGGCAVMVNQKPILACDAIAEKEMTIEPVPKYRVLKDLIVDLSGEKGHGEYSQPIEL
jgi:succinate dehydrogenase/fumarate reductase iron-sulfur protein